MPRQPKPYKEHGFWVTRPFGEFWRLCPDSEKFKTAKEILDERLRERRQETERNGSRILPRLTVSDLFVLFLGAVEKEKSRHTYLDYQRWCVEFAKMFGNQLVRELTRHSAQQFKERMLTTTWQRIGKPPRKYGPKTINHAIIALRRAFNWAIENEFLPESRNPFSKIRRLPWQGRKRIATAEEYVALLAQADDHFRDVLIALRFTSARPGDIVNLSWSMVNWERPSWVIFKHKTTMTAEVPKPRIIGMNADVEKMLRERLEKYGQSEQPRVFLNKNGKPWTVNALGRRMRNLRRKAGIRADEHGEEFVMYTNRHTFLTQTAMNPSVSAPMLAEVGGLTDIRTAQHYTHAANQAIADAGRRVADSLKAQATPGR